MSGFFCKVKQKHRLILFIFVPALTTVLAQVQVAHILVVVAHKNDFRGTRCGVRVGRALGIWTRYAHTWQCWVIKRVFVDECGIVEWVVAGIVRTVHTRVEQFRRRCTVLRVVSFQRVRAMFTVHCKGHRSGLARFAVHFAYLHMQHIVTYSTESHLIQQGEEKERNEMSAVMCGSVIFLYKKLGTLGHSGAFLIRLLWCLW